MPYSTLALPYQLHPYPQQLTYQPYHYTPPPPSGNPPSQFNPALHLGVIPSPPLIPNPYQFHHALLSEREESWWDTGGLDTMEQALTVIADPQSFVYN